VGQLLAAPCLAGAVPINTELVPPDVIEIVHSAQAAERAGRYEEARREYLRAADRAPTVRDWLLLRAAGLTDDRKARSALYALITGPAARRHAPHVEAGVRERVGDPAGAMLQYDSLGRDLDVIRLRARLADSRGRATLRDSLTAALEHETTPRAPRLATVLDHSFSPLTPQEALAVARALSRAGQGDRALAYFGRALSAGVGSLADRLAYGQALAAGGRPREAIVQLDQVPAASPLASRARFERARAMSKLGQGVAARRVLEQLLVRRDLEAVVAFDAAQLAAALGEQAGDPNSARRLRLEAARRCPTCNGASRARFLAALAAFEGGKSSNAAEEWEALQADGERGERAAAGYWAGVAWEREADPARAQTAWRRVIQDDPTSYYALTSARRLGAEPWVPVAAVDSFAYFSDLDQAAVRLVILRRLGLTPEWEGERDWITAAAGTDPERLLSVANVLRSEEPAIAARLARRALSAGAVQDARTYRLLYPLPDAPAVHKAAQGAEVETALVAALIRQESAWDPAATSRVGARGLMQVMPATGALVARRLGLVGWHPDSLYVPTWNLQLGAQYLAQALSRYDGDLVRTLASYNAGPTRVARWAVTSAPTDSDLFVERIPFAETRDYVRVVLRNLAWYRALYGTRGSDAPPA